MVAGLSILSISRGPEYSQHLPSFPSCSCSFSKSDPPTTPILVFCLNFCRKPSISSVIFCRGAVRVPSMSKRQRVAISPVRNLDRTRNSTRNSTRNFRVRSEPWSSKAPWEDSLMVHRTPVAVTKFELQFPSHSNFFFFFLN